MDMLSKICESFHSSLIPLQQAEMNSKVEEPALEILWGEWNRRGREAVEMLGIWELGGQKFG